MYAYTDPTYACEVTPTASLTANPVSITSGNSSTLTSSCTGGATYATISPTVGSVSATATSTHSVSPTSTTSYTLSCGNAVGTSTASVSVAVTAPAVGGSCSVSPTSMTTGSAATWTAAPTGGNGTYTYSWSGTDSLSGTSKSVSKTYTTAGTKTASVTITSNGNSTTVNCSNSVAVSAPSVGGSCSVSPTSISTGGSATWTAAPTGGNGTYTYSWSGTGGLTGTTQSVSNTYSSAGTYTGSVTITSNGQSVTPSCTNNVTVSTPTLTGSCSVSPTSISTGGSATWTAAPSGGTGSYTYSWSGTGGLSGTSQSVSQNYPTAGTYTGSVTITSGSQSITPTCTNSVTVASTSLPDLTAGAITPTTASPGTATSFVSNVQNTGPVGTGAGFYTLFQSASDSSGTNSTDLGTYYRSTALPANSGFNPSYSYTFPSAGTYYLRACADKSSASDTGVITESNESNNCGPWTAITVAATGPDLTNGGTTISDMSPTVGESLTLTSTSSNIGGTTSGSFPVLFQVQDSSNNNVSLIDSSYLAGLAPSASAPASISGYSFTTAGTYTVRACANENTSMTNIVTETNYGNNCGAWKTVIVSATPPPSSLTCATSPTSIPNPPGSVSYSTSGGNTGDRYIWTSSDGGGGPYPSRSTATRLFTRISSGQYGMSVTDSTINATAQCPVVTVGTGQSCTAPSGSITASPNLVQPGGSSTITWAASGVNTSCTVSGPGLSKTDPASSCTVSQDTGQATNITAQSVYTLTCDGNQLSQVIVNVVPAFQEF